MDSLKINESDYALVLKAVEAALPEEACGLLLGKDGVVAKVIAVENELHSKVTFRMDPQGLLDAILLAEKVGFDITGIFHSHPAGPGYPSRTDIAMFFYPGSATVILSPGPQGWKCRAFMIEAGSSQEIPLVFTP
jgi:proteasome lid subunit RPN8/RPN11